MYADASGPSNVGGGRLHIHGFHFTNSAGGTHLCSGGLCRFTSFVSHVPARERKVQRFVDAARPLDATRGSFHDQDGSDRFSTALHGARDVGHEKCSAPQFGSSYSTNRRVRL